MTQMAPRKNYTKEQMSKAIDTVRRGMATATAAKSFSVPRTTLLDKIRGRSSLETKMGPNTVLTQHEEEILENWIMFLSDMHYPLKKDELLASVQQIIQQTKRETPFVNGRPGKKWFSSFLKRHPIISQRISQNLTPAREKVSVEQIRGWFREVEEDLKTRNLFYILNHPERVFNADESAFFLQPKGEKVLAKRGNKTVYSAGSNNEKENLTVLVTANANGTLAPLMIVFSYERISGYIANSVNPKWGIGRSESGWMCGPTFYEYITNIFDLWLDEMKIERPVILFIDGHASHMTLHLSQFCSKKQIELVALYPNSTHLIQPMDVAVFKPLKSYWKNSIRRWRLENNGNKIRKENFAPIFEQALSQIDPQTVENGFRCSGLFPFNVQQKQMDGPLFSKEEIAKSFRILENYIPVTILEQFKKNENENEWEDKITDKSLFLVWKKIKKDAHMNTSIIDENSEGDEMDQRDPNVPTLDLRDTQEVSDNETEKDISLEHENCNEVEAEQKAKPKELKTGLEETEALSSTSTQQEIQNLGQKTESKQINIISVITLGKACESAVPTTPEKTPVNFKQNVPTPFKKALFWPENTFKETKRKRKEKIPAVITSKAWQDYHTKKEEEIKRKIKVKEKKSQERQAKKLKKDKKKKSTKRKLLLTSDSESEEQWVESGDSLDDIDLEQENSDEDFGYYKVEAKSKPIRRPCQNSYVIVEYEQRYFPGRVTKLDTDGYFISTMTKSGLCDWKWPEQKDEIHYTNEIVEIIQTPKKKNSRGIYSVPEMAKYIDFSV